MEEKPWLTEPDREEFEHLGMPCILNRNAHGAWCGYVAVAPGHPYHGKGYDDPDVEVHGGLTYANDICHMSKEGEPDNVWWFGFDCNHCYDYCPSADKAKDPKVREAYKTGPMAAFGDRWNQEEVYRDINFVRDETKKLAEQLKERSS